MTVRTRCPTRLAARDLGMLIQPLKAIPTAGLVLLAVVLPAAAENGVSADSIIFGQAAALGGPAGALGQGMKIGMEAAFVEANKAGGVKGRKIGPQAHEH